MLSSIVELFSGEERFKGWEAGKDLWRENAWRVVTDLPDFERNGIPGWRTTTCKGK